MSKQNKWICDECGWMGVEYLVAQSPFDPEATIMGCPECYGVECFTPVCAVDGCKNDAAFGLMTDGGKEDRCREHTEK